MVFSSHIFIFYFLPTALLLYYVSPRLLRLLVLTLVSYVFYAWTNPRYIALIGWATLVDFVCGNLIYGRWRIFKSTDGVLDAAKLRRQRLIFVTVSLCSNVGMLLFFKYAGFIQINLNAILSHWGHATLPVLSVVLPAGISFYTFESISYTLDIYHGHARPAGELSALENAPGSRQSWAARLKSELARLNAFACYITQFPHLVAGPIIRYQDMEQQLYFRTHTIEKFAKGVFFFAFGLSKKVLLANPTGQIADMTFGGRSLHALEAWYGLVAYSMQIYFDFSGYSDMAIGLGLMLGFEFAKNFDSPYKAVSVTDFWRRWHISLSTWLRDYLYIPLGGNRKGNVRTYFNLAIVMLIGGLWHGAAWKFLVWGGIHGAALCAERMLTKGRPAPEKLRLLRIGLTFLVINLAWVFFRADDLEAALLYIRSLFGAGAQTTQVSALTHPILFSPFNLICLSAALLVAFLGVQTWDLAKRIDPIRAILAMALFGWALVSLSTQAYNPFLYFQF